MVRRISNPYKKILQSVNSNLTLVKKTGNAPINLTLYEKKLGLVRNEKRFNKRGKQIGSKLFLTEKGHRVLSAWPLYRH